MRHPFGGIILANDQPAEVKPAPQAENLPQTNRVRRGLLKAMWCGLAGAWALPLLPRRAWGEGKPGEQATGYSRYLVMPKDFRKFNEKKRQELGVLGSHLNVASDAPEKRNRGGFLAWLTEAEAKKLAEHAEVASVLPLSEADIPGPDERKQGAKQLAILLAPNSWAARPAAESFVPAGTLAETWNKKFADQKGVKFSVSGKDEKEPQTITVEMPAGETPKELVAELKKHPQVAGLLWLNPTTLALNEEGGVTTQALGEEGGPTTEAVGEEGGPTTKALGEEATTLALGEEGGPTTRAVGEEGGPTTRARGEEGGPVPTTQALGEEGGPPPTTKALREEGGPPPTTTALREEGGPAPTTKALGEEGGPVTTQALGEEGK